MRISLWTRKITKFLWPSFLSFSPRELPNGHRVQCIVFLLAGSRDRFLHRFGGRHRIVFKLYTSHCCYIAIITHDINCLKSVNKPTSRIHTQYCNNKFITIFFVGVPSRFHRYPLTGQATKTPIPPLRIQS